MIDTNKLAKHNIYFDKNLLHINQKNKKAYVNIKHITAVELDYNPMYISALMGIGSLILGYILPDNIYILKIFKSLLFISGIVTIISAYFYVYVNIYTIGYKPIKIRGSYHAMKEIFEELKKLIEQSY